MARRLCQGCNRWFDPDSETRFLLLLDGVLVLSPRPSTAPVVPWSWVWEHRRSVAACGQGCTLVLTERYLDHQSFDRAAASSAAA